MLKRKIEKLLSDWKTTPEHKPLIVKGVRQCGKTFSVMEFARKNYKSVVYLNFYENPDYKSIFAGSLEVDNLVMMISLFIKNVRFITKNTVIVLDEIQECPEARTSLKFFKLDGRYDVIATGSLLGVKGYGERKTSIPVGYETIVEMYPLDFEEFLWANSISEDVIELLRECLNKEECVPPAVHKKLGDLIKQYIVVGGMPEAVQAFIETRQINLVYKVQKDIINSYEEDIIKYAPKEDKVKIRECYESIPRQLSKENRKFQFSVVKKGATSSQYEGSIQWIEDAGIIGRCYNLNIPQLPLDGNAVQDQFKVYMADTGLLTGSLEEGTAADILTGNMYIYKGAVFENLIAETFMKMGRKLYYFSRDSGLEIDFCIRYKGEVTLVEVKAVNGNAKSLKTILMNKDKYHVDNAIKIGDYNVGRVGEVLTVPHYMAFLLNER